MTTQPANISVTDPISAAMGRVGQVLFRPFDLDKWFTIGFCAWLALLGEHGISTGANFNFNSDHSWQRDLHQQLHAVREFVTANLFWLAPVAAVVMLASLVLWVLFLWLSSRGKFMFLHCVALDRAQVVEPWGRFAACADSLFWFRLALGLIGWIVTLPLVLLLVLSVWWAVSQENARLPGILGALALGCALFLIGLAFALVRKLTTDFVVPIMFLRGSRCLAAWGEFGRLCAAHFGHFILYLLFQLIIGLVLGILVFILVIATCCLAGCLLALPYLGTVALLPVLVFKRAYSLHYLAQFGRAYDVFPPAQPPVL